MERMFHVRALFESTNTTAYRETYDKNFGRSRVKSFLLFFLIQIYIPYHKYQNYETQTNCN